MNQETQTDDFEIPGNEPAAEPAEEELRSAEEMVEEEENVPDEDFVFETSAEQAIKEALTKAGHYDLEVWRVSGGTNSDTGNRWLRATLRHPVDPDNEPAEKWMKNRSYDCWITYRMQTKTGRAECAAFAIHVGIPKDKPFVALYKEGSKPRSDFEGRVARFYISVVTNSELKIEENKVYIGRPEKKRKKASDTPKLNVDEVEL
jgi:hypothetical protein